MKKVRTTQEIIKIKLCSHPKWIVNENNREYGWKNCCVCTSCTVGCGEYFNDERIGFLSVEAKLAIFNKNNI